MTLADLSAGRDNNLNLIRMLAASAVLVSHAYPLALGPGTPEPLLQLTGKSLGGLAVMVFFAISGFLITASYQRRPRAGAYVRARALRLLPGLFVCLMLTAYGLGPVVTTLPLVTYLTHPETALFVLRDLTMFSLVFTLPGVFVDTPYPAVVGSIWTLSYEVLCYAGVFLAGLAGLLAKRRRAAVLLLAYLAAWLVVKGEVITVHIRIALLFELSLAFAIGAAFYLWRESIPLSLPLAAALLLGAALLRPLNDLAYGFVLALAVTYATLWLAYVPKGPLLLYNRLGDYSYGIYIYAFPLQGWAAWAFGPQTPLENMLYAFPPTLLCAVLSWHLVERPAMRWKAGPVQRRALPAAPPQGRS